MRLTILLLALSLAATIGCADDDEPGPPTVEFVRPVTGVTITPDAIIEFEVSNFEVVTDPSWTRTEGQGHLQLWMDDEMIAPPLYVTEFSLSDVAWDANWTQLEGEHELQARIVYSSHEPVEGAQNASITVNLVADGR